MLSEPTQDAGSILPGFSTKEILKMSLDDDAGAPETFGDADTALPKAEDAQSEAELVSESEQEDDRSEQAHTAKAEDLAMMYLANEGDPLPLDSDPADSPARPTAPQEPHLLTTR